MNVSDFQQSLTWNRTLEDGSSAQVPLSCCLPQSNSSIQSTGGKMDCRKTPDVTNSYTDVKLFFLLHWKLYVDFQIWIFVDKCMYMYITVCIFLNRGMLFLSFMTFIQSITYISVFRANIIHVHVCHSTCMQNCCPDHFGLFNGSFNLALVLLF